MISNLTFITYKQLLYDMGPKYSLKHNFNTRKKMLQNIRANILEYENHFIDFTSKRQNKINTYI